MTLLAQVCSRKVAETVLGKEAVSALITATTTKMQSVSKRGKFGTSEAEATGALGTNTAVSMSHLKATVETGVNSESSEVSRMFDQSQK